MRAETRRPPERNNNIFKFRRGAEGLKVSATCGPNINQQRPALCQK
jgi:hypothetical protein